MSGPLFRFFAEDHQRLGAWLERASEGANVDLESFAHFRAGILKHIGMEEKVLIPAARQARAGAPVPDAARYRVDHGAIASLLVPTPTPALISDLFSVLEPHNRREEQPGGLYEYCEEAVGESGCAKLLERLRAFPDVPLNPYNDQPEVLRHVREALRLSREQWRESAEG